MNGLKQGAAALSEAFLELLYPSDIYCINCRRPITGDAPYSLCDHCLWLLEPVSDRSCPLCGKPLREGTPRALCPDCASGGRVIERGFSCVLYAGVGRDLLHRFKFQGQAYLGRKLAELMAERLSGEDLGSWVVAPVPLHPARRRSRGYNQAALLAGELARQLNLPLCKKALARRTNDPPMSLLGERQRKNLTREAFLPGRRGERVRGRNVLLVDDVYTTGSTGDACARVLLEMGARRVWMASFASGYAGWDMEASQVRG